MTTCEIPDLPVLSPLLISCIEEAGMKERFTVDECLAWLQGGLEQKKTSIVVNDIGDPKFLVVMLHDTLPLFPREKILTVVLVYAHPTCRNGKTFSAMRKVIDGKAEEKGCNTIYVSEWCFGKMPELGTLWEAWDFTLQEKIYVKQIKPLT